MPYIQIPIGLLMWFAIAFNGGTFDSFAARVEFATGALMIASGFLMGTQATHVVGKSCSSFAGILLTLQIWWSLTWSYGVDWLSLIFQILYMWLIVDTVIYKHEYRNGDLVIDRNNLRSPRSHDK